MACPAFCVWGSFFSRELVVKEARAKVCRVLIVNKIMRANKKSDEPRKHSDLDLLGFSPSPPDANLLSKSQVIRSSPLNASFLSVRSEQPQQGSPQERILNMTRTLRPKAELEQPKMRKTSPSSNGSTSLRRFSPLSVVEPSNLRERGHILDLEAQLSDSQIKLKILQNKYNLLETQHAELDRKYQIALMSQETERVDSYADVRDLLMALTEDVKEMHAKMDAISHKQ